MCCFDLLNYFSEFVLNYWVFDEFFIKCFLTVRVFERFFIVYACKFIRLNYKFLMFVIEVVYDIFEVFVFFVD